MFEVSNVCLTERSHIRWRLHSWLSWPTKCQKKTSAYEFYWFHSCMFVYKRLFLRNTSHRCNIVLGLWWAFIMKIYVEARDAWHKGASHEISYSEIQMSLNCLVSFSFRKCLRNVAGCLVIWLVAVLCIG